VDTSTRKMRSDATANSQHLLAVARETFAADGLDVPVREIARRAGLGVATVYRHFPTRSDLLAAVLAERVEACTQDVRDALADDDPWRALAGTVRRFAERQASDHGLNAALLGTHEAGRAFADERREHSKALDELVTRALRAGVLRQDVTVEDVRVGLLAIASLPVRPTERTTVALRRLVNLLLAGLQAVPV
jgi:AcrR family transcriptional regulator